MVSGFNTTSPNLTQIIKSLFGNIGRRGTVFLGVCRLGVCLLRAQYQHRTEHLVTELQILVHTQREKPESGTRCKPMDINKEISYFIIQI